jgi:hypothetical protein
MRINLRRFEDGQSIGPLFNVVSKISLISLVAPIRHWRLPHDAAKVLPARSRKLWRQAGGKTQS